MRPEECPVRAALRVIGGKWKPVRPTEEFMQAIFTAIEGADTFIFVLTPDSVTSPVCGREIAPEGVTAHSD